MTLCKDCRFWTANPNDNGTGECIGFAATEIVDVNAGAYEADDLEIFTPSTFFCFIGQQPGNQNEQTQNA
jgi:hypothetical protein